MARKAIALDPISSDPRYADAAAILRTLENGLQQLGAGADVLQIEEHLARKPGDPRAAALRERLKRHRGATAEKPAPAAAGADLLPTVAAALEVIRGGSRPPRRPDRNAAIAQLEEDMVLVREAIFAQQAIVDAIRNELSAAVAARLRAQHREVVLSQFRAAQLLATAANAEREFRKAVTDAGYTWRADLLPAPSLRSALILGSESTWDSEISRTRRMLEELNVL